MRAKGYVIGVDKDKYRVIVMESINGEWKFTRMALDTASLAALSSKADLVNVEFKGTKLKGKTGDLSRFKSKPLVILSELYVQDQGTIGYKVSDCNGIVKNIPNKELLAYCKKAVEADRIPIQNGIFVPETDSKKAFIRAYDNGEFYRELIVRNKSKNVKKAEVNQEKNEKAISKIEEVFNPEQIEQLKLGKKNGVNIKIYGNNKLSADQMRVIREALEEGIDAKLFADPEFSVGAMRMLRADLKYGVDVSLYLNPKYDLYQLEELSAGIITGVDISKYSDPSLSAREMGEIRTRLEKNIWKEHQVDNDNTWK